MNNYLIFSLVIHNIDKAMLRARAFSWWSDLVGVDAS